MTGDSEGITLTKTMDGVTLGKKRPHYHIVYFNLNTQQGFCAAADGHTHAVTFMPAPTEQDPETGEEVTVGEPGFKIEPYEADGHTHAVTEYELTPPKNSESKTDTLTNFYNLYKEVVEIEAGCFEKAVESEKFYRGEQWDNDQKSQLEAVSRAALTINMIERQVDELSGLQREQRSDLHYLPVEGGDQFTADVLNVVSKNILEQCFFPREESKVFIDQVVPGRGAYNMYVSREEDLRGEIKVERFPWDNFRIGPHEKEDLEDCEVLFKERWYSMEKLKQMYPEKASQITHDMEAKSSPAEIVGTNETSPDGGIKRHSQISGDQYSAHTDNWYPVTHIGTQEIANPYRKEYLVIEGWRRIYMKADVIASPEDEFYFNAWGWKRKDIKAAGTIEGLFVIPRTIKKIRITRIAGGVILQDENPAKIPVDDFFLVPVYAKKRGNYWWGKVEGVKDPQREVNKRTSQTVDITNKMASYGWFIDSSTFPDSQAKEQFKRMSTSPGFVATVTDTGRPPYMVEGTKVPSEVVALLELAQGRLVDQMNVTVEEGGANESGAHMMQRQKKRLTGNEFLFDNNAFAKKKVGRLLVYLIQDIYTPDRMLSLLRNEHMRDADLELGGQPMEEYSEEDLLELLTDMDLTKVDTVVEEASFSPTHRLAVLELLDRARERGVEIPNEFYAELVDMPKEYKSKLLAGMAEQQAQQSEMANSTQTMEENKTLLAKGIIPGSVKIRLKQEEEAYQQEMATMEQGQGQPPEDFGNTGGNDPLAQ